MPGIPCPTRRYLIRLRFLLCLRKTSGVTSPIVKRWYQPLPACNRISYSTLQHNPSYVWSYDIPVETFETNVMGTVNVLESLRRWTNQQRPTHLPCVAVMITTDKCYENQEWLHAYREEDPMGGHDPYSASKGCAELAIASYRNSFFEKTASTTNNEQRTTSNDQPTIRLASASAGNVIGGGD